MPRLERMVRKTIFPRMPKSANRVFHGILNSSRQAYSQAEQRPEQAASLESGSDDEPPPPWEELNSLRHQGTTEENYRKMYALAQDDSAEPDGEDGPEYSEMLLYRGRPYDAEVADPDDTGRLLLAMSLARYEIAHRPLPAGNILPDIRQEKVYEEGKPLQKVTLLDKNLEIILDL
jgi:hypothetical protein